jgi:TolA-binding protein
MLKRFVLAAALGFAALSGGACSDRRAEELFDTAQLEELQNSPEHARQLYRELIDTYPESPYAAEAQTRLEALTGGDVE